MEKAQNYCSAAGVALGDVLHIEDLNPDVLRGSEGHVIRQPQIDVDDGDGIAAIDPSAIAVGAAVLVA